MSTLKLSEVFDSLYIYSNQYSSDWQRDQNGQSQLNVT